MMMVVPDKKIRHEKLGVKGNDGSLVLIRASEDEKNQN